MLIYSSIGTNKGLFAHKEGAINYAKNANKPFKHTIGFVWKNPTTLKKEISLEEAIIIMNSNSLIDIEEKDDYIHLNTFSSNDMW